MEGTADGGQGAVQVQAVADLLQGEVGLLGEELAHFAVAVLRDSGRASALVGTWL